MSIYDSSFIMVYCIVLAAILGAVFGSFLNCAAWRIAHKESFLKGRSHCTACGHVLSLPDLIPVFSWLFLRGRCRYCGEKVSARYLLAELFFALMAVLCLLRDDLTIFLARDMILACCLFCLSLVDLEIMEIPDGTIILAIAAWVLSAPFTGMGLKELGLHVLALGVYGGGLLLISLLFDRILKRESMGGGDIKLLGVAGLYLGLGTCLFALILACILGLVFGVLYKKIRPEGDGAFPFGPAIAMATWLMLLYGAPLTAWYFGLF